MPLNKLSVSRLSALKHGLHSDGGNLYLQVGEKDGVKGRSWVFRFQLAGKKPRDMGLGGLESIGLVKARELAAACRELVATGIDPIEYRRQQRAEAIGAEPVPVFQTLAEEYIAAHRRGWKNTVHAKQWPQSLKTYAYPTIGKLPVNMIGEEHVLRVLRPIWHSKNETARRVRGRIERILGYATVLKHRKGDNPARWTNHISAVLAAPSKVSPVEHNAALPYGMLPGFMQALRQRQGIGALALEFTVLTCARTNEALGATWDEIEGDTWTVPARRMKAGKEHRVPLSAAAKAVLKKVRKITADFGGKVADSKFIFPNDMDGGRLSENTMLAVLRRMGLAATATTHGFRSSFRDWSAERTNFPRELCEMALAHRVSDRVEAAYRRGDMFNKRHLMMEAWGSYCAKPVAAPAGKVLPFAAKG